LAVTNALLRCAEIELESVGIPDLGACLGFPLEESARLMLAAIAGVVVPPGNALRRVFCILDNEGESQVFDRVSSNIAL
jgi:O-acetyl-ADP-ribose deacetylase (regulator of RNase III)